MVVKMFKLRYPKYNCLKMPNKKIILSINYKKGSSNIL